MILKRLRRSGRRANVSVEFALIAALFLLPLFGGSVDMVQYISAKDQLNTALQSLYYYALTYAPGTYTAGVAPTSLADPTIIVSAANTNKVLALMANKVRPLTLVAGYPTITYYCLDRSGNKITATANNQCTSTYPYEQIFVQYQIQTTVNFIVPMPFIFSNPLPLTATGSVEIF